MSISKILFQTLCVFSQIKDRKHIEQNFHSVAMVMPPGWDLWVLGGVKNFSVGICDGAPSYGSPGGTFLLITYHLLLTTYYLSLITYYLLLTTYHLLLTTYYLSYHRAA